MFKVRSVGTQACSRRDISSFFEARAAPDPSGLVEILCVFLLRQNDTDLHGPIYEQDNCIGQLAMYSCTLLYGILFARDVGKQSIISDAVHIRTRI